LYHIEEVPNIDEVVRRANAEIQMENRNLQAINIQLHEKYHTISLKVFNFYFIDLLLLLNLQIFLCQNFLNIVFDIKCFNEKDNFLLFVY